MYYYSYYFLIDGAPPILQDEVFEESIVDFFETADTNKDGVLDYNDFYMVSYCKCSAIESIIY